MISPETANWIILENEEQWQFFQLLTSFDLGTALKQFCGAYENAQYTVMQIVAKHFDNLAVRPKNNGGSMQMYLTNECNMRCPHCYMFAGLKKDRELSTKEIFDIISSFRKRGGVSKRRILFFYKQSPDFHKPGLCHVQKILYL